jgi:hypothetical protein
MFRARMVPLRCESCAYETPSALFYRGAQSHVCTQCRGRLVLADPLEERRTGKDRRRFRIPRWPDWRSADRRAQV